MTKLPRLSGKEVIKALSKIDFETIRQKGSHVFLKKTSDDGSIITTVIPLHNEIDRGTLLEIIRQCKLTRDEFLELV